MKFYDVDENYVRYLRTIDSQIPDVSKTSYEKFVFGIVLSISGHSYYAPVSSFNQKQRTNFIIYDKSIAISSIRFCYMFPALNQVLQVKNFAQIATYDKPYADLLDTEYRYCMAHIDEINSRAASVYRIGTNKNHKFNYTCCDFLNLEAHYTAYDPQTVYPKK